MTRTKYLIGFLLSLALTILAFVCVVDHVATGIHIMLLLGALAIVQAVVQLVFFLHLGDSAGSKEKLIALLAMLVTLLIVVVGSIWIMNHLNYNMMQLSPNAKSNLMLTHYDQGGF